MVRITKAALAAELGVTRGRVTQYAYAGMPVLPNGKVDRDVAIRWVAENHYRRTGGNDGARRAKELLGEGYAGREPEGGELLCSYKTDGSVEWYRYDLKGERVVEYRQEAWERLGFQSAEAYARWLRRHGAI